MGVKYGDNGGLLYGRDTKRMIVKSRRWLSSHQNSD